MRPEQGKALVQLARAAIHRELGKLATEPSLERWMEEPGATFVTLTRRNELRGCIGSIEARRSLHQDVRENAVAAAMRDPRFWPMTADELHDLGVEVTLLSALEALPVADEADACSKLRPGVDGVVLSAGRHRATFIPQMWEKLPEPKRFLAYLKDKAGLPIDPWEPSIRLQRFTVEIWRD